MSGEPYTATMKTAPAPVHDLRGVPGEIFAWSRAGHKRKTSGEQPLSLPQQFPHGGRNTILSRGRRPRRGAGSEQWIAGPFVGPWHLLDGVFVAARMLAMLADAVNDALAHGYAGSGPLAT
jgi:hypothetical protein